MSRSDSWNHLDTLHPCCGGMRRASVPDWRDLVAVAIFAAVGLSVSVIAAINFGIAVGDIFTT